MRLTIWITVLGVVAISPANGQNEEVAHTAPVLHDYPIRPVPFEKVELADGFWARRLETNRNVTLPHNVNELKKQGSFTGFEILAGDTAQEYRGWMWGDSDVYKTLEGMAYCLKTHPDAERAEQLEAFVEMIIAAQAPDGYLAPHLQLAEPEYVHFSEETTRTSESYNFGHFIEMTVAHYETTGDRRCLQSAVQAADLLGRIQAEGELEQIAGHGEIELALIRLYRATNDAKYVSLAGRYVRNSRTVPSTYCAMKPFLERDEAWGHAVAAGYLYSGGVDVAVLEDDAELLASMERIWENVISNKLFLTGGVGLQRAEDFGADYDLPSARAYAETCASIAMVFWNHRMFLASGDAKYIDVLERTLYNGFLAGIAMRAKVTASYCWQNDTLAGVNDGIGFPDFLNLETKRLSWWPHQGTEEWVQYDFAEPTEVKAIEVCWFDDSVFGRCRAPKYWKLLYADGEEWKPVNTTSSYETQIGAYNRLTFTPVKTGALRLVVQLQPEFTAGVQEWRVE